MTLNEASAQFQIDIDMLKSYEENGLFSHKILADGVSDYSQTDIKRIALIRSLQKFGMGMEELKRYFDLADSRSESKDEQIRLLKKQRCRLLEEIHEKQQSLDELDFMISEAKNGAKR
ncbi:MAG: MerR family transcriptional regulator [Ruminococcaceae bacterium]|nr:MerR family transcriptional regulator [Oscillospiraceae bacterium]